MKKGYTKSLITTASSKTNYLQRSNNSKVKVTCIYSKKNKVKNDNQIEIKSKSNKPLNFKKNTSKISRNENLNYINIKYKLNKNNKNINKLKSNLTVQNLIDKNKSPQKLKVLSVIWFTDIKNNTNKNNNNNIKTNFSSNKKSSIIDFKIKHNNLNNINDIINKNENNVDLNDTISNFLNYNLGEFNNEHEFEDDFFESKLDPFINSLIDKKKKKNKTKEEIKKDNLSEKEFEFSHCNCNTFKKEVNKNKTIFNYEINKEKNSVLSKRNISDLTQNSSYYYSNTEELKPSEKIHSIYRSKFSLIKKDYK